MKAADRCRAQFQGDRCKLEAYHGQSPADPVGIASPHMGMFHSWYEGDRTDGLKPDPRNLRQARKDLRKLCQLGDRVKRTPEALGFYTTALKNVENFFRGVSNAVERSDEQVQAGQAEIRRQDSGEVEEAGCGDHALREA